MKRKIQELVIVASAELFSYITLYNFSHCGKYIFRIV